jgi:integrase
MFSLAWQSTPPKVAQVPYIPKLKENNVRKGFFERADFLPLREALPEHLKGFVTFAYHTGWRKSEIEELTWAQVNRLEGTVYLNPGDTKNDEARSIYLDEELKAVIEKQWEARKKNVNLPPYVFLNAEGDDRLKDFRKAWGTACEKIGRAGMLFHDFRRSAVRNMVRSGIQEKVAMKISGHKTRAIFDRYNIVNDEDLMLAAERQKAYLDSRMVTNTVTVLRTKKNFSGHNLTAYNY